MFCGRCCATELRMKPALPLDIFIEILPRTPVNKGQRSNLCCVGVGCWSVHHEAR